MIRIIFFCLGNWFYETIFNIRN